MKENKQGFWVLLGMLTAAVATICVLLVYWEKVQFYLDRMQQMGKARWEQVKHFLQQCPCCHKQSEKTVCDENGVDESCFAD